MFGAPSSGVPDWRRAIYRLPSQIAMSAAAPAQATASPSSHMSAAAPACVSDVAQGKIIELQLQMMQMQLKLSESETAKAKAESERLKLELQLKQQAPRSIGTATQNTSGQDKTFMQLSEDLKRAQLAEIERKKQAALDLAQKKADERRIIGVEIDLLFKSLDSKNKERSKLRDKVFLHETLINSCEQELRNKSKLTPTAIKCNQEFLERYRSVLKSTKVELAELEKRLSEIQARCNTLMDRERQLL
jgi:hypothetical protein